MQKYKKRGIYFFLAENDGVVNNELIQYGAEELIETGVVIKDVDMVFEKLKINQPYPLKDKNPYHKENKEKPIPKKKNEKSS